MASIGTTTADLVSVAARKRSYAPDPALVLVGSSAFERLRPLDGRLKLLRIFQQPHRVHWGRNNGRVRGLLAVVVEHRIPPSYCFLLVQHSPTCALSALCALGGPCGSRAPSRARPEGAPGGGSPMRRPCPSGGGAPNPGGGSGRCTPGGSARGSPDARAPLPRMVPRARPR